MTKTGDPVRIGVLHYPNAQAAAVYGLIDMFRTANRMSAERGGDSAVFEAERVAPDALTSVAYDAVIIPPSLDGGAAPSDIPVLSNWINSQHAGGVVICSVCAGAFLLAETGLLDGRRITTHWALAEEFAARFPEAVLDIDRLVIDDGDVITAGGLMAWVDLGLRLIERFAGPAIMLAVARFFLVDPSGREQSFYSSFAPNLTHSDAAILSAQRWLQAHSDEQLSMPLIAEVAGLGERTFLRRFQKATGLTPSAYLQQLRIGKARDLMELTVLTIDEIAWKVGYGDASAFRRVFQKITGLTPSDYRIRFQPEPR